MSPMLTFISAMLLVAVSNSRSFGSNSGWKLGDKGSELQRRQIYQTHRLLSDFEYPSSNDLYTDSKRSSISLLQNKRGSFNDLIQRLLALRGEIRSNARKSQMRFGGGRR